MWHRNSRLRRGRIIAMALVVLCALTRLVLGHDGTHLTDRFEPWQLGVAAAVALAGWALVGWVRRRRRRRSALPGSRAIRRGPI